MKTARASSSASPFQSSTRPRCKSQGWKFSTCAERGRNMAEKLREGFTTGSAATGAALAALQLLRTGTAPDAIPVPLPPFRAQGAHNQCKNTNGLPEPRGWLRLKIEHCAAGPAPELGAA